MNREDAQRRYELGAQRLTDRDLAFNGLLDKRTFAAPHHATDAQLQASHQQVSALVEQAAGRAFTPAEELQWQSALSTQASHYAAEEGRAR
jgi:hypothetical protein